MSVLQLKTWGSNAMQEEKSLDPGVIGPPPGLLKFSDCGEQFSLKLYLVNLYPKVKAGNSVPSPEDVFWGT